MSGKRSFVPPPVVDPTPQPGAGLRFPKFPKPGPRAAKSKPGDVSPTAQAIEHMGAAPSPTLKSASVFDMIPLTALVDSPYQPRIFYNEDKLAELAEALKHIQIDPLLVRPVAGGRFEIISGHRRRRAAVLAQLDELKCQIVAMSDVDARVTVLSANESREEFTDFERALAYRDALEDGKATKGEIQSLRQLAARIGVSHTLIHRRLTVLDLPDVILGVLREYPAAFSSKWVDKLKILTASPVDEKKLREQLVRVATGEMQMTALFSVMATSDKGKTTAAPRQALSLQRNNRVFAQITPNLDKRQITVKLPDQDCDVDEVAQLLLQSIQKHYGATG